MTAPDIAAIEARLAAATPGPWVLDYEACDCGDGYGCSHGRWPYQIRNAHHQQMTGSPEVEAANMCGGWPGCEIEHRHSASELAEMTAADAELIAHAPTDLAALLAEVNRLREREADDLTPEVETCPYGTCEHAFAAHGYYNLTHRRVWCYTKGCGCGHPEGTVQ